MDPFRSWKALRTRGLGVRLLLPTAIVTGLLAAGLVGLQLLAARRAAADNLDHTADLVGRTVLDGLRDAMRADDRPRLKKQLAHFAGSKYVRRIDVIDKTGEVVFSSDAEGRGEKFSRQSATCTACHDARGPTSDTGHSIRAEDNKGQPVYRFVLPIVAAEECLECHEKAKVGQTIGILMADLDEEQLGGRAAEGARQLSWALLGAFAILLGSVGVVVRTVVVARLQNVKRLLEFVRAGTRASTSGAQSFDEIDELEHLVQSVAEDLEDKHALRRAAETLTRVLEQQSEPVVLVDSAARVLAANRAYAGQPGVHGDGGAGALLSEAREQGWALGATPQLPLVAAVDDVGGRTLGFVQLWAPPEAEARGQGGLAPARVDPEWQLYTAALVSAIRREPARFSGVLQLDRRLTSGRKLLGELSAAAGELTSERSSVELRSMLMLILWDLGRALPDVSWHALLDEHHVVTGARYQLRALVQRLAQAAATQARPGGHAVLFTQVRADKSKLYVGAWARSDEAPGPVDGTGRLPLCELLARNHGGGIEVDPSFDLGPLCAARGVTLPGDSRGVLFVAELEVRAEKLRILR